MFKEEVRFDPSAKLAFWWTLRLGEPIPSGWMSLSVGGHCNSRKGARPSTSNIK